MWWWGGAWVLILGRWVGSGGWGGGLGLGFDGYGFHNGLIGMGHGSTGFVVVVWRQYWFRGGMSSSYLGRWYGFHGGFCVWI